ncbi:MAG: molybdopterin molybdotransferase MoeA [Marinosulfonomonas sp.]|nr:molybdopterin molybdotransferase MoeA [Marinosulfonomonas sp.]
MISVEQALELALDLVAPLPHEDIPLAQALGRVLARPVVARRDQPPFSSSAMDGYAVRAGDTGVGAKLAVIGTSAAGHGFDTRLTEGQAARIFTGAPVPAGADTVVIQEDVTRIGDTITLQGASEPNHHIRAIGSDFKSGDEIAAPRRLSANDLALLAAMNIATVPVTRAPVVALIATGDELVMPGQTPGPDQIIASNSFGLMALARQTGAKARLLPIARDSVSSLKNVLSLAADADLIVTIGGASVGDHDLVASVAADLGLERAFYKIAMRPGKPLMAGRLGDAVLLGLPGNPVSSMVCGHVFMLPMLRKMLGLGAQAAPRATAKLAAPLPVNGARAHYMRARVNDGEIAPAKRQDSALLSVLADVNALLIRPVDDPAREIGESVEFVAI